jgi:tetratricopeptide (TPR) repeat protein
MIVKNEEHIILRTLINLTNYVKFDYWVISDTGSTDSTKELINDFFKEKNIPGELIEIPWRDFAYNRTAALEHAFNKTDYVFIFDADDEIIGNFTLPNKIDKDNYIFQYGDKNGIILMRPQLFNNRIKWKYVGVLHEYIEPLNPIISSETIKGNYYFTLGHGGSRSKDPEKYYKDAIILEKAFYDTANDINKYLHSRYAFYCAQSYENSNIIPKSIEFYKKVLELDGWLEEKYASCIRIYDMIENKEEGLYYLDKASEYNNNRIECIYRLVNYYLLKNEYQKSYEYYKRIQNYYENEYFNEGIKYSFLFVNSTEYYFYLPYFMIIVSDRIKKRSIGIKMYEMIFKYKFFKL